MSKARNSARTGLIVFLTGLLTIALGGVAWAPPPASGNKVYQGNITPHSVAFETQDTFTLQLTNDTDNPGNMGSANLYQPVSNGTTINMSFDEIVTQPSLLANGSETLIPGASASIKSGPPLRIELRNLNLAQGQTMIMRFKSTAPCSSGTGDWVVQPKQANNWSGPSGNDIAPDPDNPPDFSITITGGCFQDPGTGLTVTVEGDFSGTITGTFGGTLDCSSTTTDPNEGDFLHLPEQFNLALGTDFQAGTQPKVVTFTFSGTGDSSHYRICYSSTNLFKDIDGDTVSTGYLPDCVNTSPPLTRPCVREQYVDFDTLKHVIVTEVPNVDPSWR